jgi:hypothetical protein
MTTDETRRRVPPAWVLELLNGLAIVLLVLPGARWPFGYMMAIVPLGVLLGVSAVWHLVVERFEERLRLRFLSRWIAYLFPVIAIVGMAIFGRSLPQPVNQQRPAIAPGGRFTARVVAPGDWWEVHITGTDGSKYDETTEFFGHLNVYWLWDASERLWIYNSDDGVLHFWHLDPNEWEHVEWGRVGEKKTSLDVVPPAAVFPDYAKKPPVTTRASKTDAGACMASVVSAALPARGRLI